MSASHIYEIFGSLLFVVLAASGVSLDLRRRRHKAGQPPVITNKPGAGAQLQKPPAPVAESAPPKTSPSETAPPDVGGIEAEAVEVSPELAPEEEAVVEEATQIVAEAELTRPRFADRLSRARSLFSGHIAGLRGRSKVDAETWDELEEALILADVGINTATSVLESVKAQAKEEGGDTPEAVLASLKQHLCESLEGDRSLRMADEGTTVWLFVGVNGVGKTTTIGKVALREATAGGEVVIAAGDTFRAAAADQLEVWAERAGAKLIRGAEGSDPGAVVFDAVQHAAARKASLVLADTAGRLHNKVNLMEELKKVRRVAERPPGAVTEVLLVIDATTGQNGLVQAKQFAEAVGVTGVVLTKLDGTAKGGIAVAIASELGVPIKLVGLGEGVGDLVEFDEVEFVDALFAEA